MKVGYMYREKSTENNPDSGWRFFKGNEDGEYMNNPDNYHIFALNTVCNYDNNIIPYINSKVGSTFIRINDKEFEVDNQDKRIYMIKQ